jgi:hypothetical protein
MKALKMIFLIAAACSFVISCSQDEGDITVNLKMGKAEPTSVTVPFKADFTGTYLFAGPDASCGVWNPAGGEMWGMIINEGTGTGTHLGRFTSHFEFCCEFITGVYPGNHMVAYLTAANGDVLFVSCAGQVLNGRLDHHPEDVNSYFMDPFVILGGTGRFEGASGSGFTDDYNRDSYPENSFHHWRGTITLFR